MESPNKSPAPLISASRSREPSDGKRNAERTKSNLLNAAYVEFSENGFQGARVDAICKRAGVSKQMLAHHFGSKEALFVEVLERAYLSFRMHDEDVELSSGGPVEAVEHLVLSTFDHVQKHQELIRLLSDENMHNGRHIQQSTKLRALYTPLIEKVAAMLERGERAGLFRSGVDPYQFYISMTSLIFLFFSNNHTLSAVFDRDFSTPEAVAERRRHVVEFVLAGLRR